MNICRYNPALDALILLEQFLYGMKNPFCNEEFTKKCENELADYKGSLPYSSSILSQYVSKLLTTEQLDNLNIDSLIELLSSNGFFANSKTILSDNSIINNYIKKLLEDCEPYWNKIINAFKIMRSYGYDKVWCNDALNCVIEKCNQINTAFQKYDVNYILNGISILKDRDIPTEIRIYLSYYSPGHSYALKEGMCFQNIHDTMTEKYLLRVVSHELLHGFAKTDLLQIYNEALTQDSYFADVHLENKWYSGEEEMFVKAAEHYIVYKAGIYSLDEIYLIQNGLYGNSLPLMVIIFDLLVKNNDIPRNYNSWLIGKFKDGNIRVGKIKEQCDEIITGYSNNLYKHVDKHDLYIEKLKSYGLL